MDKNSTQKDILIEIYKELKRQTEVLESILKASEKPVVVNNLQPKPSDIVSNYLNR